MVYVWLVDTGVWIETDMGEEELMTFGGHIRLAGAVVVILSFFLKNMALNFLGLMIMAIGVTIQVDSLERRVAALEPKEKDNDETEA